MSTAPAYQDEEEEEEEDNFNPDAEVGSDNEEDPPNPVNATTRARTPDDTGENISESGRTAGPDAQDDVENEGLEDVEENGNDEEEENDDDEEEEDDDEDVQGHRQKRRRRDRRNQFIDVEAEVDEEDEEAEEDDDDLPEGFVADIHPDDEGLAAADQADDRRHRDLDRRRQEQTDLDLEKQAALYKERYSRYGRNGAASVDSAVVPQRLLLPSVEDPTIWGVRCKPGKEREVVLNIMKRVEERAETDPVKIFSAFERGNSIGGFIYVEARKQFDVEAACENIMHCYVRTNKILVPIAEMPDLLRTRKSKVLEPGMYVRIKRGKYQGDLAQVEEVEANGLEVELRLVPRLDYGLNEDVNAPMINTIAGAAAKRKRANGAFGKNVVAGRPPQRLFSDVEAKKKHGKFIQQRDSYDKKVFEYLGDTYIRGFLVKGFKVQHLQTEDVNPKLEEVTRFTAGAEDGTENLDLSALAATLRSTNAADYYLPGDMVEVYQGEQRGVSGKAIRVHADIVTLSITEGGLRGQTIEAPIKSLRKRFREGDHVKVIGGSKYQDEVGMVVRIKDDRVTLLSDSNNQEITVFSRDLRAATDSGNVAGGGKFDLYDLVQLEYVTL